MWHTRPSADGLTSDIAVLKPGLCLDALFAWSSSKFCKDHNKLMVQVYHKKYWSNNIQVKLVNLSCCPKFRFLQNISKNKLLMQFLQFTVNRNNTQQNWAIQEHLAWVIWNRTNRRKTLCSILILKRCNTHANHFQCASCYQYQISDVTLFAVCSKVHKNKQQLLVKGETLILSLSTRLQEHRKNQIHCFTKWKLTKAH